MPPALYDLAQWQGAPSPCLFVLRATRMPVAVCVRHEQGCSNYACSVGWACSTQQMARVGLRVWFDIAEQCFVAHHHAPLIDTHFCEPRHTCVSRRTAATKGAYTPGKAGLVTSSPHPLWLGQYGGPSCGRLRDGCVRTLDGAERKGTTTM